MKPHTTIQAFYEGVKNICLNHTLICLLFEPGKWHLAQQQKGQPYSIHTTSSVICNTVEKVVHVNLIKASMRHMKASLLYKDFSQLSVEWLLAGVTNVFKPWSFGLMRMDWYQSGWVMHSRASNKSRGGKRDKWTPHICCEVDIWFQGILCTHWEACIQNTSRGLLRFHYLQLEGNKRKNDLIILITCSSFFIWSTNRIQFETQQELWGLSLDGTTVKTVVSLIHSIVFVCLPNLSWHTLWGNSITNQIKCIKWYFSLSFSLL